MLVEIPREDRLTIMNEEAIVMVRWDRFAQLLQRPRCCGVCRHVDMQDAPRGMFQHHKDIEQVNGGRDHHTEIHATIAWA